MRGPSRLGALGDRSGLTLLEVMVAIAVLTIGVVGMMATFGTIQRGVQGGKNKTLAANLAQEKMQIIKQQTYFRVIPTANPAYLSDGTPYDTVNFSSETILEGGVEFSRYTYVQVVTENSGALQVLPPTSPDTGMRQIAVTVAWVEAGKARTLQISSVMANPNSVEANCAFTGSVADAATGLPIQGALVNIAENAGWRDSTDASGAYLIRVSPGTFNVYASAYGYFSKYVYLTIGSNNTVTQSFSLTPMSSGTVMGTAWINPGVVISQVVVSTVQAAHGGFDVEYVELYNPTTAAVTVNGGVNLSFAGWNGNRECDGIPLTYVNSVMLPDQYFLIANTTTFTVNGVTIAADAYYTDSADLSCSPNAPGWNPPSVREIADRNHAGTWWLSDGAGNVLDAVGWSRNGLTHSPSRCEGDCVYTANGLDAGWELVRLSSPGSVNPAFGRAYDSGDNALDFTTSTTLQYSPFNTASPRQAAIAGVPAVGGIASVSDGLSDPAAAVQASVGPFPVASFSITNVATGTWIVLVTSGPYELENDTVTVPVTGFTYLFPSSTTILSSATTTGFISGRVTDAYGGTISGPAVVVSGSNATGNATPRYLLRVSTGLINVTANANFVNPSYVSVSSLAVPVALGQVANGVDFVLSQGGRLSGWVTRDGVNGLAGVTVMAMDAGGIVQDQEVSGSNGNFTTVVLATGAYTVQIPLDTTEVSSPTVAGPVNVSLGTNLFVATFTIVGDLGTITGKVTQSGNPVSTGVLIVVSTSSQPSGPPNLSSASLTSGAFYAASSREDGTYSVDVRQSTSPPYFVYGYYSTVSNSGAVTLMPVQSKSNVQVTAGQTVQIADLQW